MDKSKSICEKLRKTWNRSPHNLPLIDQLLDELKVSLLEVSFLPTETQGVGSEPQGLLLAREMLEIGAMASIEKRDISGFEHYMAQLKHYYLDYKSLLEPSPYANQLMGLNLLSLLARNKLSDFHTEIELLPPEQLLTDVYLCHPIHLEQFLMEGSYNKVFLSRDNVPAPYYRLFVDILLETVREEIVSCILHSYSTLSLSEARKMLYVSDDEDMREFGEKHGWVLEGNYFSFISKEEKQGQSVPAMEILSKCFEYARDLEAIV
ncbi:26S proteasome non-ATPase regulatory subunit 8-like [Oopsacas minuta]|uniref:26S proteasome non-ATPase regulatory subunit 8 n=1 Tax=Oopsacas minuta TaxID=111878 RepID=A0AAV7K7F5_9METZ|nr:26S proteasome non-ATPase regulatory subunit 8-like [Oopsacas minuta]